MQPRELIHTARVLAAADSGRPRQANLRRAVSTAYYALFHCLARSCADAFVGTTGAQRNIDAWHRVHRALGHREVVKACKRQNDMKQLPKSIQNFAKIFVSMQEKRHQADYSLAADFSKSEVEENINGVEIVVE